MNFTNDLVLRDTGDGRTFLVEEPFTLIIDNIYSSSIIKGFRTDLASVPRIGRIFIAKTGKQNQPAVVHDKLYKDQYLTKKVLGNGNYEEVKHRITRARADKIFLDAMKIKGVSYVKRKSMYLTVRAGGWMYWNKCAGC